MSGLLSVIQADRDAVQAFHRTMLDRLMADVKSKRPKLGDDEGDAGTLVQAFARHRLSATTPGGDLLEQAARETLLSELSAVARAMDLVDFHAREPDLDLKPSACRAIIQDAIRAIQTDDGGEK